MENVIEVEYINDVLLNREEIEEYCDRVNATEWERNLILLKVDSAYEWAHFMRDVYEFLPLQKFVRPGTFNS